MAKKAAATTPETTTAEQEAQISNAQTVQNVQKPKDVGRESYFEMAADEDGDWYWTLWSGNGRQMAISPIGYGQQSDCKAAIQAFNGTLGKKVKITIATSD